MLTFLDGPAAGQTLMCARVPLFLRVVHTQLVNDDDSVTPFAWDALDQLQDKIREGEWVHVYRKTEDRGSVHYHGRDKHGKKFGRWEQCATYMLHENQPDFDTLRDTKLWQTWATAERERFLETTKTA